METFRILQIFIVMCLCWAGSSSQAINLHQKINDIKAEMVQIKEKLNETITCLHDKVDQINEKMESVTGTLDELDTATSCPANFTYFEGSCYYISVEYLPHAGWDYARALCQMMRSHLVAIETKREADFLLNFTVAYRGYWTSGHKHGSSWVWETTGVNITDGYAPWYSGRPNSANYCAYFHGSGGALLDCSCSQTGRRYICETKLPTCI